ncbi:tyrosine-protein phosphatase [Lysinibacillus sp. LZ02]|uniref:tyrosine-protein phosphatase n=1 Tax=Lysinibacillus sp. LZ02 TaxID=3420668 RepID=UPI003D36E81E
MSQSMDQIIALEGVLNFRDMGGYKTNSGKLVKRNLFFRSANLAKLTLQDQQMLKRLGIKTIFDYRDDHEATHNPTPVMEGIQNIRIPAKGASSFKMPGATKDGSVNFDFYKQVNVDQFTKFYAQMPFNNPSFQRLMQLVKNENNLGLLHHCAVGKDRTGIGGTLILMLLDVPRETIMQEYLLTNRLLTPLVTKMAQKLKTAYPDADLTTFYEVMSANEKYLNAVFHEIDKRYESEADFLQDQFSISKEARAELQVKYLE